MKGIVLAGGYGTRLHPATLAMNKQLLPVYDKPMVYYPISTLMLAGIREILIISNREFMQNYRSLFGDGSALGLSISYAEQPRPEGLPQAFTIAREWISGNPVVLILGDNILYSNGLVDMCLRARAKPSGATIFGYRVNDPQRYGVIGFDAQGRATSLEEKPSSPRSNFAMIGLYFFDGRVCDIVDTLVPSKRGELEITDLARKYLEMGELHVERMGRGCAWFDAGTHDSLLEASEFVRTIQNRQGIQIACLEEIAYHQGFITAESTRVLAAGLAKSPYGAAILDAIDGDA